MNSVQRVVFRFAGVAAAAFLLCCSPNRIYAQAAAPDGSAPQAAAPAQAAPPADAKAPDEDRNPFAPSPAPPLPPGMMGSNANDPRY
ncbi:MAG: hypothetical protein WB621_05760, partial [Candidatus Acidiferrales bacterium]